MRKIFLLAFFLLCATGAFAQALNFRPHWKVNETFSYYFFKNSYHPKDSAFAQDKDTVIATFKVLTVSNKGYEVQLKLDYAKSLKPVLPLVGMQKVIANVKKKKAMVIKLDTLGQYDSLKNWKEIKDECIKVIDAEAKKDANSAWSSLKSKFSTREQIEKYFTRELQFYFLLYGSVLRRSDMIEYEDVLENPFDASETIPARVTLETKEKPGPVTVEVSFFMVPDLVAGKDQITRIKDLVRKQEENPGALADEDLFDVQDYYVYLHNTKSGTHQNAIYVHYVKKGSKENVESWKFMAVE